MLTPALSPTLAAPRATAVAPPRSAADIVRAMEAPRIHAAEGRRRRAEDRLRLLHAAFERESAAALRERQALADALVAVRGRALSQHLVVGFVRELGPYVAILMGLGLVSVLASAVRWGPNVLAVVAMAAGIVGLRQIHAAVRQVRPLPGLDTSWRIRWELARTACCTGLALVVTAAVLLLQGVALWAALPLIAAALIHGLDLALPLRDVIRRYAAAHPVADAAQVQRYHVERSPGVVTYVALDAFTASGGLRAVRVSDVAVPTYGGQRLAHGDVVVHVGRALDQAYLGYAAGQGFLDRQQLFAETGMLVGFTARWATAARRLPAWDTVAETATPLRPMLGQEADADADRASAEEELRSLEQAAAPWEGLFLPEAVVRQMVSTIQMVAEGDPAAPSGALLNGPPGTGKTELARVLARVLGSAFIPVVTSDLKRAHVGGTEEAVKAFWARVRQQATHGPIIVYVDECDSAFASRTGSETDVFGRAITEGFLAEWQGLAAGSTPSRVLVLGSTNNKARIDSAIVSRFGEVIDVGLPDESARAGILGRLLRESEMTLSVTRAMVQATAGLGGRDIGSVVKQAKRNARSASVPVTELHVLMAAQALRKRTDVPVSASASWDTLVIADALREQLLTVTEMLQCAESITKQGIDLPRSYLFEGPPGTGKTEIARVLANESGLTFIAKSTAEIKGTHLGETSDNVHKAFADARAASPAILYFDEIDLLAKRRGSGDQYTDEFIGQFLQETDGAALHQGTVFILASTNRVDVLDSAVRDRFLERVHVGLPDEAARAAILSIRLRGKPVAADVEPSIARLAAATDGWSGRDLRNLVGRAERFATNRARRDGTLDRITVLGSDLLVALEESGG